MSIFLLLKKIKCIINLARCAFSFWCFYWDLFLFFVCVIRSTICGLSVKISAWFLDLINPRGFHFIFIFFLREIKVKPGQGPTDTDKRFFSHPAPLSRQLTDGYTERTENFHGYRSLLVQSIQHLT